MLTKQNSILGLGKERICHHEYRLYIILSGGFFSLSAADSLGLVTHSLATVAEHWNIVTY